ncbi:MAG: hypothetical protein IPJ65_42050 [Archangiaceae bacterium]|nr:hypothetical protein [Archangiaceae bacterium]
MLLLAACGTAQPLPAEPPKLEVRWAAAAPRGALVQEALDAGGDITALGVSTAGDLVLVAGGRVLERTAGELTRRYLYAEGSDPAELGEVSSIVPRASGGAWLTSENGLFALEGRYVTHSPVRPGMGALAQASEVASGPLAGLWLAASSGVYRRQPTDTVQYQIAGWADGATGVAADPDGTAAIAIVAGHLVVYRPGSGVTLDVEEVPDAVGEVHAVAAAKGALYAATARGLYRWRSSATPRWTRFTLANAEALEVQVDPVTASAWVLTAGALLELDGDVLTAFERPSGAAQLAVDHLGDVWTARGATLVRLKAGATTAQATFESDVKPWVQTHCAMCHSDFADRVAFAPRAQDALQRVRSGDMPRCWGRAVPGRPAPEGRRLRRARRVAQGREAAVRIATAVTLLCSWVALGQTSDAKCELARPMEPQRLLRRLSLDLRGYVPSYPEQLDVRGKSEVPAPVLDGYLASADFVKSMRRYHEGLLWPNLDAADVDTLQQKLVPFDLGGGDLVYFSVLRALFLRTVSQQFPPCRNAPLELNPDGSIKTYPLVVNGQTVAYQEGWVRVEPYWAPGTQVKVCGFDAQASATGKMCEPAVVAQSPYLAQLCGQFGAYASALGVPFTNAPVQCDTAFGFLSAQCGCGPALRLCSTAETAATLRQSLIDQQMRVVEDVVAKDLPYTDVLLRKRVPMNGPIAHYLTWQSRLSFDVFGEVDPTDPVPSGLSFVDTDRWVDVERTGRHSGLLTTPGYLLKYQSNRGRAHRYYNAFECSSFLPNGPLPSPQEACSKHEDLTQRCGCNACHIRLEPMAAHWGRFAEYGLTPLGEERYPKQAAAVCSNLASIDQLFRCFRFYNVQPVGEEAAYRDLLRPYVFRTAPEVANLEVGPAALARASIDSGKLASCTVRKLWGFYLRREPTPEEEQTVVPQLAADFSSGGYHLKQLVKAIVTQPAYRRLP